MGLEPWERELILELNSRKCHCGRSKERKRTFCKACYFQLPEPIRKALWRDVWDGYATARIAAGQFLKEEKFLRFETPEEFEEIIEDVDGD